MQDSINGMLGCEHVEGYPTLLRSEVDGAPRFETRMFEVGT